MKNEGIAPTGKAMTPERSSDILDQGRADVLPAGCAVVTEIVHFLHCSGMIVSLSDLLEGPLLDLLAVFAKKHSFHVIS